MLINNQIFSRTVLLIWNDVKKACNFLGCLAKI